MIQQEIFKHLRSGKYQPIEGSEKSFRHALGWSNHLMGSNLLYSHRTTDFTPEDFDESYHAHAFYELIVYIRGEVDFLCNQTLLTPPPYSVVWTCPGEYHNARLLTPSRYERYVFRFSSDLFTLEGEEYPIPDFMKNGGGFFAVEHALQKELSALLSLFDTIFATPSPNRLLARGEFFHLLSHLERISYTPKSGASNLPQTILQIKEYIEKNYASIASVSEVADRFFYSREHISRLFKQYFNMSVSEYLTRFRVAKGLELLETGHSVTDACFAVGFGSMSTFSGAFRRYKGCLPSKWKRQ